MSTTKTTLTDEQLAELRRVLESMCSGEYCDDADPYHAEEFGTALDELVALRTALAKINEIRNSIIGFQTVNWSEHVYPLVAALNEAGIEGMEYDAACQHYRTMFERLRVAEGRAEELNSQLAERDAKAAAARANCACGVL